MIRSEFEGGDIILVQNIKKSKKLPGTKNELKYRGPYTVYEVTPCHLIIRKDPATTKTTKVSIRLSQKYQQKIPRYIKLMIFHFFISAPSLSVWM